MVPASEQFLYTRVSTDAVSKLCRKLRQETEQRVHGYFLITSALVYGTYDRPGCRYNYVQAVGRHHSEITRAIRIGYSTTGGTSGDNTGVSNVSDGLRQLLFVSTRSAHIYPRPLSDAVSKRKLRPFPSQRATHAIPVTPRHR